MVRAARRRVPDRAADDLVIGQAQVHPLVASASSQHGSGNAEAQDGGGLRGRETGGHRQPVSTENASNVAWPASAGRWATRAARQGVWARASDRAPPPRRCVSLAQRSALEPSPSRRTSSSVITVPRPRPGSGAVALADRALHPLHGLEAQPCTVSHDLEPGVGTDAEGVAQRLRDDDPADTVDGDVHGFVLPNWDDCQSRARRSYLPRRRGWG